MTRVREKRKTKNAVIGESEGIRVQRGTSMKFGVEAEITPHPAAPPEEQGDPKPPTEQNEREY